MNFTPNVPWYRRYIIGDKWPNRAHWKVLQAQIGGVWLIVERHTSECTCSYCEGEHGHDLFWMPPDRSRGWRVINLFHRLYIRWAPL